MAKKHFYLNFCGKQCGGGEMQKKWENKAIYLLMFQEKEHYCITDALHYSSKVIFLQTFIDLSM